METHTADPNTGALENMLYTSERGTGICGFVCVWNCVLKFLSKCVVVFFAFRLCTGAGLLQATLQQAHQQPWRKTLCGWVRQHSSEWKCQHVKTKNKNSPLAVSSKIQSSILTPRHLFYLFSFFIPAAHSRSNKRQITDLVDQSIQITSHCSVVTADNCYILVCGFWDKSFGVYSSETGGLHCKLYLLQYGALMCGGLSAV